MSVLGTVESLWRYPVKSMRGERLNSAFVGGGGIKGDRLFAFSSSASRPEFPYFTGRDRREMLLYRPQFRKGDDGELTDAMVDVESPTGETFAIDDPALIARLRHGLQAQHRLTLMRSERALADAYPISIISLQTVQKLGEETDTTWDQRRFRANIYVDFSSSGTQEEELVGRSVRIGGDVVVSVAKRDIRCMMITIDPDTAARSPALLKNVAQRHDGAAGVYGSVVAEGMVHAGDAVQLLE